MAQEISALRQQLTNLEGAVKHLYLREEQRVTANALLGQRYFMPDLPPNTANWVVGLPTFPATPTTADVGGTITGKSGNPGKDNK
jgi:hypothetical protein